MLSHNPALNNDTNHPDRSPRKAVGYVRTSTQKQDVEDDGLEKQAGRIRTECAKAGFDLIGIAADVASAAGPLVLGRRAGLGDASRMAQHHGAVLVVTDATRLFRNLAAHDEFSKSFTGDVYSLRDGGIVSRDDLRRLISAGEEAATSIQVGTKNVLAQKKEEGVKLGSPKDLSTATHASIRSRRDASQELAEKIAYILEENEAYSALSHKAFADLLNRKLILTTRDLPWTSAGVRRHRKMADQLLAEQRALDAALDAEELVKKEAPVDDAEMKQNPFFGMF